MLKAIIIDDEIHCIDTLSILLADYCPEVTVLEKCNSAKRGLEAIEKHQPDLVFLDIEMPVMNGFELLEQFKQIHFSVVFTTSYDQYAIKAIRFSALDYLLKPIDPKELITAVHKVQLQKAPPSADQFKILLEQIQQKDNDIARIAAMLDKNNPSPNQPLSSSQQRRLAAILFTDIVGYTSIMQQNENAAIKAIRFSALDYLLKPIDPKELITAVHKVQLQKAPPSADQFKILLEQIQQKDNDIARIAAMLDKKNPSPNQPLSASQQRRLAAILFTDIVGYTSIMQQNEIAAIKIIKRHVEVLNKYVISHSGEILNDYGDGSLCIFPSAAEAVQAALEIQQQLQIEPTVPLRIGLHIGEIFFENGKIIGDGVNVASRIQSLGTANTVLFSEEIQDKIKNNPLFKFVSLGSFKFKNVEKPIKVFALTNEGCRIPLREQMDGKTKKTNWVRSFLGIK